MTAIEEVDSSKHAPAPTVRRLPGYHRLAQRLLGEGAQTVSCTTIALALSLDPTQVRKDIAITGIVGKPKVGYEIRQLLESIESFLGWDNVTDAFLVGAGSLGTALLGYKMFNEHGLKIVAAFDNDRTRIGVAIRGVEVLPIEKLPSLAGRMHVKIGVIATPAEAARDIAALLVASGIEAIWNFAPVHLDVPPEIIVEDVHLTSSLAVLSAKLTQKLKRK